jgi:DNA-binding NarL/FixJ family response regulator
MKSKNKSIPDCNMPITQRESIKNKIAELTAHGLNSNEIAKELSKISKAELIRVIKDYQEGTYEKEN